MALEFKTPATQYGRPGALTVLVTLSPLDEVEQSSVQSGFPAVKPKPFGDSLRGGVTRFPVPLLDRFGVNPMAFTFEEIISALPGCRSRSRRPQFPSAFRH